MSGLFLGLVPGSPAVERSLADRVITATTAPVMAALTDAQTPADGFTAGVYESGAGTIASQNASFFVNSVGQAGSFALNAGDVVYARETVVDSAGFVQTFDTATVTVSLSVALSNATVPVISGTAEIGETLTVSDGTWNGSAARTFTYQWTRNGVDIAGATANTFALTAVDDGLDIGCEVTADDGFTQVTASAVAVSVTYPAPVSAGALPDVSYDEAIGPQTVDASGDFTGAVGGTWSVSGVGASIDQSGVVTITTDAVRSASPVTVTYTNSGGAANSAFGVTVGSGAEPLSLSGGTESFIDVAGTYYHVCKILADGTLTVASSVPVEYLIVGGGGATSGGANFREYGGGGAGQFLEGSTTLAAGSHNVIVGEGGQHWNLTTIPFSPAANGQSSFLGSIEAIGGGSGGQGGNNGVNDTCKGKTGASGGGGSCNDGPGGDALAGFPGAAADPGDLRAGGGGGSGGPGIDQNGGPGSTSDITGVTEEYAGGGGASVTGGLIGGIGQAGGGDGSTGSGPGMDGTPNTGSGAGASGPSSGENSVGSNGGKGIVIVRTEITEAQYLEATS